MKTYREVLSHYVAKEFREAAREYGRWCKEEGGMPPHSIELKYKIALHNYRVYLDGIGMKIHCKVYRQNK